MANSVDLDETARYKPSHLDQFFAQIHVSVLVCRAKVSGFPNINLSELCKP